MAMTKLELAAKHQIMDRLGKQGYPTYARLLDKFDVNLTADPNVIGYMEVKRARIVLNKGLNINQVSTIVRHEILHEYLTHYLRSERWKKAHPAYQNLPHDIINTAADYEISNVGYTDADKATSSAIVLNGQILRGLVTEYDHPGWENLSFEELLDKLAEEYKNQASQMQRSAQIGDKGDPSVQEAEEIERQANAISDDAGEMLDGEDKKDMQKAADQIADKADAVKDAIEQNDESKSDNNGPFETPAQQAADEKIRKRIEDLKKALRDVKNQTAVLAETEEKVDQERVAKKAKDAARYKESPMVRFQDSLNAFIRKAVATGRGPTWTRINKKYSGSGILKPGSSRLAQNHVPLINVYFDRSGSWDSAKTVKGQQAIATLNKYVRRGELKIDLYYFSNNVHSKEEDAMAEGGTSGQPILDHIKATKPDNVIILTDSDIGDCNTPITVPGGVWMLFYGGRSENLIDNLHGLKLTRTFDIEI